MNVQRIVHVSIYRMAIRNYFMMKSNKKLSLSKISIDFFNSEFIQLFRVWKAQHYSSGMINRNE